MLFKEKNSLVETLLIWLENEFKLVAACIVGSG